jgi:hypothetical protein
LKTVKIYLRISICFSIVLFCCSFLIDRGGTKNKSSISEGGKIKELYWLIGNWQNISAGGSMFEFWQLKNDSVLSGSSYFIKGTDTLSSEKISLEMHGQDLFYIPVVREQNGGKPVTFQLTSMENYSFVFENPLHDFPQKVTYHQLPGDSLLAEISGVVKGKMKVVKFPMVRSKK